MTASSVIATDIRTYIEENFLYMRPGYVLDPSEDLLARGIVDSMGVMEIVYFLQDRFGIEVDDADITAANLGSVEAMSRYVASRWSPDAAVA